MSGSSMDGDEDSGIPGKKGKNMKTDRKADYNLKLKPVRNSRPTQLEQE